LAALVRRNKQFGRKRQKLHLRVREPRFREGRAWPGRTRSPGQAVRSLDLWSI